MRLYFPSISWYSEEKDLLWTQAYEALQRCKDRGTIDTSVGFKTLETKRTRTGYSSLEVQLEAYERNRGRRWGNSGSYGATSPHGSGDDIYAATYDEWGFLLAELYQVYPNMLCGSPTYPEYDSDVGFHHVTGRTYDPSYIDYVATFGDDYGYRSGRNQIGRRGYGRVHYQEADRYDTEDPRDAAWLRAFHAGEVY